MKPLPIIVSILFVCVAIAGIVILLTRIGSDPISTWTRGLRVKFDIGDAPGVDFFFPIPLKIAAAIEDGWTLTERPSGPLPSLIMYCPADRIVCALYDDTENVAGLNIAVPQDEITDSVLDWHTQGYTAWTPPVATGQESKTYWTIQQYFISPQSLSRSKEERAMSRSDLLQDDAVWVTGFNGELVEISDRTEDIHNSIFTLQACIQWMGTHYYYNMTADTECTSTGLFPWFPLVDSGELIGTGLLMTGNMDIKDDERDWFERPASAVVHAIVPNGPTCLYELATRGIVTMHIYYVDEPWTIMCE